MAFDLNGGHRDGPQHDARPVRVRAPSRSLLSEVLERALVGLCLVFAALAVASTWTVNAAASSHLGPVSALEPHMAWLLLFGFVFVLIAWLGGRTVGQTTLISARGRGALNIVGGLLLALGLVAVVSIITTPSGPTCDNDPATALPPCEPPGHTFTITFSIGTTAGSTVPAAPYDSCDTEAGGTTGEWTTSEGRVDMSISPVKWDALIAIDTDLATTAALWTEPNCLELDHDLHLNTPVDQNGDGVADSITYYGGIDSISRVTLSTDGTNGTLNAPVFVKDGIDETADWDILWKNDAGSWIPACVEYRASAIMGSSCADVAVGAHTGSAADDDVDLYLILEDRGPFGYQEPAVGAAIVLQYHIAGKSAVLNIILNSRGTTNLS